MNADSIPLVVGLLVFFASLFSLKMGLPVAILEIFLGSIAGNLVIVRPEAWMVYLANFGGRGKLGTPT